jgi:SAM-dependent methyltransferase/uncharacterized protein YbaR (Trm112 family)
MPGLDPWYADNLACPRTHEPLAESATGLDSPEGVRYPVVEGIPVLLRDDVEQTIGIARASLDRAHGRLVDQRAPDLHLESLGISEEEKIGVLALARQSSGPVDPVVSFLIAATNGIAYRHLLGRLDRYPIPDFPLEGRGTLLDLGCSWGRWTIAASRQGFEVVGLDPSLGALMAARRAAKTLGAAPKFVCGDARFLPFRDATFDAVFSYSVLQHLSEADVELALGEVARVLKPGGVSLIQMPNRLGLRCLYHQTRRRFRTPTDFEVRYWSLGSLKETFNRRVGLSSISVDCFFGLGLQKADAGLMPASKSALIRVSETLRRWSMHFAPITRVADSVFILSHKPASQAGLEKLGDRGSPD